MTWFVNSLVAAAVALSVAVGAWLLLPACGVQTWSDWLRFCPADAAVATRAHLARLDDENTELARTIALLERELAARQCTAVLPAPVEPAEAPEIDRNAWEDRDIAVLGGCWALDSDYRTRNVRTGEVTVYDEWTLCFDESGRGRTELRATDGVTTCEGPIAGRFAGEGNLVIEDAANVPCSDGSYIYRSIGDCRLDADGRAICDIRQPETRGTATVQLRRAEGTR